MTEWWISLSHPLQFFYVLALVSTGVMFVMLIMNIIGFAGADFDVDGADVDVGDVGDMDGGDIAEHSSGLGLLSVRTVLAFFAGFGWGGIASLESQQSLPITILVGSGSGLIFMFIVFWLMKFLHGLAEEGNVQMAYAKGQTGTVYLRIPPAQEGRGQIQVVVQSRLREIDAITDSEEAIPTGAPVKVVKVLEGNTMLVRQLKVDEEKGDKS